MAWIYLAVSEDCREPWSLGCGQSPFVRLTDTLAGCSCLEWSPEICTEPQYGMMCARCGEITSRALISSTEVSLARISALQAAERAWKVSEVDWFSKFSGSPEKLGQPLYSWKMCRRLNLVEPSEFAKNWPAKGMIAGGVLYLRPKSEPPTSEKGGFSLLPTPSAARYGSSNNGDPHDSRKTYRLKGKPSLWTLAKNSGGTLAPQFVEWMMGLPSRWSVLEDWATAWCRNKRVKPSKN